MRNMKDVPTGFRIGWTVLTSIGWATTAYLAFHRSMHPDVWGRYSNQYFFVLILALCFTLIISLGNVREFLEKIYVRRQGLIFCILSSIAALCSVEAYVRQ